MVSYQKESDSPKWGLPFLPPSFHEGRRENKAALILMKRLLRQKLSTPTGGSCKIGKTCRNIQNLKHAIKNSIGFKNCYQIYPLWLDNRDCQVPENLKWNSQIYKKTTGCSRNWIAHLKWLLRHRISSLIRWILRAVTGGSAGPRRSSNLLDCWGYIAIIIACLPVYSDWRHK